MAKLYVIGGSPRSGKTTAMYEVLKRQPMTFLSTDALRFGMRNALFGEPRVMVEDLRVGGEVTIRKPGTKDLQKRRFSWHVHENEFSWKMAAGIIDHYDLCNKDIAIEGIIFTPAKIHALKLKNLEVRAAFVGFSDKAHGETILRHAQEHPEDWINEWLAEEGGAKELRAWLTEEVRECKKRAELAARYGYGYFDITQRSFPDHVTAIQDYLLKK